jgi:hypothetical protein
VRAMKRNPERFPADFAFQLTADEWKDLRCQFGTSSESWRGRRYLPYAVRSGSRRPMTPELESVREASLEGLGVRPRLWRRQTPSPALSPTYLSASAFG